MAKREVVVTANKIRKWHMTGRIVKLTMLALLSFLMISYIVLRITYSEDSFVVNLKSNKNLESGLALYESLNDPTPKRKLVAESIQFMDNITEKWLPDNIHNAKDGSHNGDNYIAYTFYVENQGTKPFNYWYQLMEDDVIRDVDEAIRVKIYINDEATVYAKKNGLDGEAEPGTTKFREDEDGTLVLVQRKSMQPGDVDKFTVVVWIEGNDPDCVDALIGGEMRMHMDISEEHTKESI